MRVAASSSSTSSDASAIEFYSERKAFGWLSNFYGAHLKTKDALGFRLTWKDREFPTSEHAYQSENFEDEWFKEQIRSVKSPALAAMLGRQVARSPNATLAAEARRILAEAKDRSGGVGGVGVAMRADWTPEVRIATMKAIVSAKFDQNPHLCDKLLATGRRRLVEHTHRDTFFADGGDGTGLNHLGRILEDVRDTFSKSSSSSSSSSSQLPATQK